VSNNLNVLIPVIVASLQRVLRQTGFVFNAVTLDASNAAGAVGQTIQMPNSVALTPYDVTPGAVPPALTDITPTQDPLVLTKYRATRFHLTGEDWRGIAARGPEFRARQMDEAIAALMHEASAFVWGVAEAACGRALGAVGTDPFASNPNILVDGWQILADAKAPDIGRFAVLSTQEYGAAAKLAQFQKANEAAGLANFGTLSLGMLSNFRTGYDQAIGTHAKGTENGAYVVDGAVAAGASVVTVKTGAGTILAGDVVSFGASTNLYVVKSLVGTTLTLNVPLLLAVADLAAVVVKASHRANLLIHPDAVAAGFRAPAEAPDGDAADMVQVVSDPVTGIALRIAHYKGYHAGQWETSIVYGAAPRRRAMGVKLIA
jgi:hypothetical protein